MSDPQITLEVELEVALVRALHGAWRDLNWSHFRGKLRAPQLRLADATTRLGRWVRDERTIEIGRAFAFDASWGEVVEVLKHEMAHQYVSEELGDPDGSPHGPAFQALCEKLAIDGRAAGRPDAAPDDAAAPRVLQRIAKLLALAGSANQHEAESAMAEAQRLMLAHNLETAARQSYRFVHLGEPTGRVSEPERLLANLLSEHFFVEVIWVPVWRAQLGKRGSVLEVCGSPVNLEMATYVHAFMQQTAARLWDAYRRSRQLRSQRDRRAFLAGVMAGFKDKLDQQRAHHQTAGLVWVGDADLRGYFKKRHPRIRWTHYRGSGQNEANADGRAAGRNVTLHRPITRGPSSGPRLLGSG